MKTEAMLFIDENYNYAKKTYKRIKNKSNYSIAFILGNYELNGLFCNDSKIDKTNKLLKLGYDLVIEIPYIIYLTSFELFSDYLTKLCNEFNVEKIYLPSENSSLKQFKNNHSSYKFYYPSYDKIFHQYLNDYNYLDASKLSKDYITKFYQMRVYDYLNLNLITSFKKNMIKYQFIKSNYTYNFNNNFDSYFKHIKLYFTYSDSTAIKNIEINTVNMLKNKLYKINNFDEFMQLSLPKNFQFGTFFRSILLTLLNIDPCFKLDKYVIKYLGFNRNGSNLIRNYKKINKENHLEIISNINPSNSMIEKYQYDFDLLYSYLFYNKYNSNSDLYIFPIKFDKNY